MKHLVDFCRDILELFPVRDPVIDRSSSMSAATSNDAALIRSWEQTRCLDLIVFLWIWAKTSQTRQSGIVSCSRELFLRWWRSSPAEWTFWWSEKRLEKMLDGKNVVQFWIPLERQNEDLEIECPTDWPTLCSPPQLRRRTSRDRSLSKWVVGNAWRCWLPETQCWSAADRRRCQKHCRNNSNCIAAELLLQAVEHVVLAFALDTAKVGVVYYRQKKYTFSRQCSSFSQSWWGFDFSLPMVSDFSFAISFTASLYTTTPFCSSKPRAMTGSISSEFLFEQSVSKVMKLSLLNVCLISRSISGEIIWNFLWNIWLPSHEKSLGTNVLN